MMKRVTWFAAGAAAGAAGASYAKRKVKENAAQVSPTVVALKTELSIQEAEKMLEEMARKGYALMRVTESGRL